MSYEIPQQRVLGLHMAVEKTDDGEKDQSHRQKVKIEGEIDSGHKEQNSENRNRELRKLGQLMEINSDF